VSKTIHIENTDSLSKRYLYKLGTNIFLLLLSILTAGMIPRALGPSAYGNFSFLSFFFIRVVRFFDLGTSSAFYIKLSQRQSDYGLLKFYWWFVAFVGIITIAFVFIALKFSLKEELWPDQQAVYIWLAAIWGLLTWMVRVFSKIVDAYSLTTRGEIAKVFQKILGTGIILLLFFSKTLDLNTYFAYHFFVLVFIIATYYWILRKNKIPVFPKIKVTREGYKNYKGEFYKYAAPLVFFGIFGLVSGIFDRWILQTFGGSAQQGFFGLSSRISEFAFIFTGAMTTLIMRDFTIAFKDNNLDRLREMFQKYVPILYLISVYLSLFVFFHAKDIAYFLGGDEFKHAATAVQIMALYPIHQTYGQLLGAVFLAMEKTKFIRNVGITFTAFGIPFLFLLLAPEKFFGLNLGATGLAIKMVSIQFISITVQLWFACRFLNMSFSKLLGSQFLAIVIFGSLSFSTMLVGNLLVSNIIISFLLSGIFYTILGVVFIYLFPSQLLISRQELFAYQNKISGFLAKPFKK
jgi:O-antigen/teichoic acid export membrane protein